MEKQQEYKIGAAANEFVNEHRAELSSIKKAELEAMLKDFAIQQVKKLIIPDVSKPVCPTCGSKGYKTSLTNNSYACKKCLTWWVNEEKEGT
jgi:tRNA(Ile2) C34 agmatinyltransferase TiaS